MVAQRVITLAAQPFMLRYTFLAALIAAVVPPAQAHAVGYRYSDTDDSISAYVNTFWLPVQDHSVLLGLGGHGHFTMRLNLGPHGNELQIDALFTEILQSDSTHANLPYTGMRFTAAAELSDPKPGGSTTGTFIFDSGTGALQLNNVFNWDATMELIGIDLPPISMRFFDEPFIVAAPTGTDLVDITLGLFSGRDGTSGPAPRGVLHEMGITAHDVKFAPNPEPSTLLLGAGAAFFWRRRQAFRRAAH